MEKKNTRLNNIINDLSSSDTKKTLTAIKQLRKHGKREAILPLVELLSSTNQEEVRLQILSLLIDLKDQNVAEDLILAIEDDRFTELKPTLISIFWQSNLNGSDYLSNFVREAIKGDYMTAIEVMTVIDSFDDTFSESEIQDLKFDLEEAIPEAEEEKAKLLIGLRTSLDNLSVEF